MDLAQGQDPNQPSEKGNCITPRQQAWVKSSNGDRKRNGNEGNGRDKDGNEATIEEPSSSLTAGRTGDAIMLGRTAGKARV